MRPSLRSRPSCTRFPAAMSPWGSSLSPSFSWGPRGDPQHENQTDGTSDVETITPAPASMLTALAHVPASISAAVGVTSPDHPITPPTATGNASLWESLGVGRRGPPGGLLLRGRVRPVSRRPNAGPSIVALSRFGTFQPARADAVQLLGGVLRHPHLHLLAGQLQQRLGGPADRRALQLARPDRGRLHAAAEAHGPPGGLGGGLRHLHHDLPPPRHREPLRAGGIELLAHRCSAGSHRPRSPPTWPFPPAR